MRTDRARHSKLAVGLVLALAACAAPRALTSPVTVPALSEHPGKPRIAVLTPSSADTMSLVRGLSSELGEDYSLELWLSEEVPSVEALEARIVARAPRAVVLLNNPQVALYAAWQARYPREDAPAAVVLMAAFARAPLAALHNATGVLYEPPAVTAVAGLRGALGLGTQRLGVVYRHRFRDFIEEQARLAEVEHVTLVGVEVEDALSVADLKRAMGELRRRRVDAVWVLNDNALVQPRLLHEVWFPLADQADLPLVVGVASFVDAERPFGTFGVVPDSEALGVQAAAIVIMLSERGWKADGVPLQQPISVKTYLDLGQVQRAGRSVNSAFTADFTVGAR